MTWVAYLQLFLIIVSTSSLTLGLGRCAAQIAHMLVSGLH